VPTVILAAGLMVLVGVGLFVAAVITGIDALYWVCVAVCVAAAALLFLARRRLAAAAPTATPAAAAGGAPPAGPGAGAADVPAGTSTAAATAPVEPVDLPEPDVEDVEVTDLLLVVDLKDEVFVLDEHPRYHLAGCLHLRGRTPIPLPHDEARADGFTPCAVCEPDHTLADQVRARKAAKGS
jgi:hypothetical protein